MIDLAYVHDGRFRYAHKVSGQRILQLIQRLIQQIPVFQLIITDDLSALGAHQRQIFRFDKICLFLLRRSQRGSVRLLFFQHDNDSRDGLRHPVYLKIRVEELCRLFAGFYKRPADWDLLLKQLDLDEKRKRPVHKLSGGEKQRLSILLSLMGRPRLLILDELTTGLDPEVRQNMWISFENIRKSGIAIIMVSHYLDEVETLADKILYLEKGKQLFFGTQQEFREYVRSRVAPEEWEENVSLEKLYLMIAPKTTGLTMEGIL